MKKKNVFLGLLLVIALFFVSCMSNTYKQNNIHYIHPIHLPEYGALGSLVSIYIPENRRSFLYEAYQNIAGIANLEDAILGDLDNGLAVAYNNDRNLSPTIKNFMRDNDIKIMLFEIDGQRFANVRLTNPEAFIFVEWIDW